MVKVYRVEFKVSREALLEKQEEDLLNVEIPNLENPTEDQEKEIPEISVGNIHVLAYNIGEAFVESHDFLESAFGEEEGNFEICKIIEEEQIQIVNYEGDTTCNCPACRARTCSADERLEFNCNKCGAEIVVADGWEAIQCFNDECDNVIFRKSIKLGSNGKYYIDVKINEEELSRESDDDGEEEG